jgi:Cu2+-exporting ATPase
VIVEGESYVDESILTGESKAVRKRVGNVVAAGTLNSSSELLLRATAIGNETRLSQIVGLVEKASLDKPKIVVWANKIGGYFVTALILLALMTFFWWATVDVNVAIDRTIALLIVACPCALALATPLAIAVAIGRAARQKIMVKGGDVLQSLQKPGMIWMDKTGTLTDGELYVSRWYGDTGWLDSIAAMEVHSSHPVAQAIVRFKKENWHPHGVSAITATDFC